MTKIVRSRDCGNSPKNRLVENLAIALSTEDRQAVSDLVTDDIQWRIIGGASLRGREAVLQALTAINSDLIVKLIVSHVVTHGKSGAVDGTVCHEDAEIRFCDVFEFSSAKGTSVSQITSYRIEI